MGFPSIAQQKKLRQGPHWIEYVMVGGPGAITIPRHSRRRL